jgi:hypothetical protein
MAIKLTGSGGSIKFSGTGGSLSIRASGGGGGGGGSPSMTGLKSWWRADDITVSDGSAITTWPEHQGNGNDLSAVTYAGGPTPLFIASEPIFNGQPAVSLVETAGLRKVLPSGFGSGNAEFTVYMVLKIDPNYSTSIFPISWGDPTICQDVSFRVDTYPGQSYWGTTFSCGSSFMQIPTTIGNACIIAMRCAGAAGSNILELDGTAIASNGGVPNVESPVTAISLGGRGPNYGSYNFNGLVAEVLYYDDVQTAEEITATYSYLSSRYGISI